MNSTIRYSYSFIFQEPNIFGIQYSMHFQNLNIFGIRSIFTIRDNTESVNYEQQHYRVASAILNSILEGKV